MRLDIVNGSIVTGDGVSLLENTAIIIEEGLITDLPKVSYVPYNAYADKYINANGGLIIPGIINIHSHGIAFGPFFPYGWRRPSPERILFNLDTHLLQGTTTLINGDGFALPFEVEAANKAHPVNIKPCTAHFPASFRAAEIAGAEVLDEWHKKFTAEEYAELGAVAIGEIGSPGTTAGTSEKSARLGKVISVNHAKALDKAVINGDEAEIRKVLTEMELPSMSIAEAKKLVEETSILPVEACCDAIRESAIYVKKLGIPVIAHAEPGMREALLDAAKEIGPMLIATHVNHSFTVEEMVSFAKELKALGATVEVITADFFGAKQVESSPEGAFALLREGLVDEVSTDYSGGYHEPILLFLQKAIEEKLVTLPQAIKLATSASAGIVPRAAAHRGLIAPGKVADLCIVDKDDISKVRYVIIAGKVVVEEGKIVG